MNADSEKIHFWRKENILTVPNVVSLFRLLLIPLLIWLYLGRQNYAAAIAVIALSGVSDIADGRIARKYGMVSDFGKMLDPIVDKLTQAAMFICLLRHFPHMLLPLIILAVKELVTGAMSLAAIRRSSTVLSAEWPGKLTTGLLYAVVLIHILFPALPSAQSDVLIGISIGWLLYSFVYYGLRNIRTIRGSGK